MNGYILSKSDLRTNLINKGAYKSAIDALEQTRDSSLDTLERVRRSSLDYLGKESEIEAGSVYNQYADTIEQAYASAQKSRNALLGSNITSGYKQELSGDIDTQLDDIYRQASDAYKQKMYTIAEQYQEGSGNIYEQYQKESENIYEQYQKGYADIYKSAEEEADYTDQYASAYLDYYDYIKDDLINDETVGSYFRHADGTPITKEELIGRMYSGDELTDEGRFVFDLLGDISNRNAEFKDRDFSTWLRTNKTDLYDWANSPLASENYRERAADTFAREMGLKGSVSDEDIQRYLFPYIDIVTGMSTLTEPTLVSEIGTNTYYIPDTFVTGNNGKTASVGHNWGEWNNFTVTINGETFDLESGKPVDDKDMIKKLDNAVKYATGRDKHEGDIIYYNNQAYVYANDDKWRTIGGRKRDAVTRNVKNENNTTSTTDWSKVAPGIDPRMSYPAGRPTSAQDLGYTVITVSPEISASDMLSNFYKAIGGSKTVRNGGSYEDYLAEMGKKYNTANPESLPNIMTRKEFSVRRGSNLGQPR